MQKFYMSGNSGTSRSDDFRHFDFYLDEDLDWFFDNKSFLSTVSIDFGIKIKIVFLVQNLGYFNCPYMKLHITTKMETKYALVQARSRI